MTGFPPVLTETGTFTEHNGIWIGYVGEDGNLIALGHHDPEQALAAFKDFDSDAVWCDYVDTTWAVLVDPPTHDNCMTRTDPAVSCLGCDETEGVPWWMQWGLAEGTPDAFPVMVMEA